MKPNKFRVYPLFETITETSEIKAWFISDDETDGSDYYLWKNGSYQDTTGYVKEKHNNYWDAPGFWKTEQEARKFLKQWKEK